MLETEKVRTRFGDLPDCLGPWLIQFVCKLTEFDF